MIDWQEMLKMHQELNQFARIMLTKKQKEFLTSSERELLVWIYLNNGDCTPLYLSKASGMKKEAVSRCIKSLLEKDCVERKRSKIDERSYFLSLTDNGEAALQNDFGIMLQKFYDLYREMGEDFEVLFHLIAKANEIMTRGEKHEIL